MSDLDTTGTGEGSGRLPEGTQLQAGRYTVTRILGQGGHATVYLAQDATRSAPVAIKQLGVEKPPEEKERQQFQVEAELLRALSHPRLVKVWDLFEEQGSLFLVMDFLEGESMDRGLSSPQAPLPEIARVLAWADEICDALEYLHSQHPPVVMRDLKPANLMLGRDGALHLIDFGIARSLDGSPTIMKGAGTPGYAAPEQYGGARGDTRADVFSLGATLYALLTHRVPPAAVARAMDPEILEPPSRIHAAVPEALDAVILKMMEMRPARRYATIREAREALQEIGARPPAVPLPAASTPSPEVPAVSRPGCLGALMMLPIWSLFR